MNAADLIADAMAAVSEASSLAVTVETEWGDVFHCTLGELVDDNLECIDPESWCELAKLVQSTAAIVADCGPMRVSRGVAS